MLLLFLIFSAKTQISLSLLRVQLNAATVRLVIVAEELRKLTKNYRLGLGTFVDKKTMPYVSLEE